MEHQESPTILVADDEPAIRRLVRLYMEREGFQVREVADGDSVLTAIREVPPHILVLDVMMPGLDGFQVCQEVRKAWDIPIIMLTARGEESERILGLELGADDYLVKPFSPRELVARVKALLRRSGSWEQKAAGINRGSLFIETGSRQARVGEETLMLTPREYDLLFYLAAHPGKVFSRERILEQVWGYDFYGDLRTVDTHVKNLREKLRRAGCEGLISTVWGVGYRFEADHDPR